MCVLGMYMCMNECDVRVGYMCGCGVRVCVEYKCVNVVCVVCWVRMRGC